MSKIWVRNLTMSLDGYVAGPDQSLENPLGVGAEALHEWAVATRAFREMHGMEGGETGLDDDIVGRGHQGIGAFVMGRNMFGPVRGPWEEDGGWNGWWGENPPYHQPVFVLTHHERAPLEMKGGTTFHFVTDGLDAALGRARRAAGGDDILIGGGASIVRQCLASGVIDEMHIAVAPLLLGRGERLFVDLEDLSGAYTFDEIHSSPRAAHFRLTRRS